ncbi:MAG: hypothetical protein AB1458_07365 [Bacteroidota bacterium]
MTRSGKCIKCNGDMQEGVLLDFIDNTNVYAQRWISREDADSLRISAGKVSNLTPLASHAGRLLTIKTYRCGTCGYLESYA